MVYGDLKETLNLVCVKIHGHHTVYVSRLHEVGY